MLLWDSVLHAEEEAVCEAVIERVPQEDGEDVGDIVGVTERLCELLVSAVLLCD